MPLPVQDLFANVAASTLAATVSTTPAAGTSETWTLVSTAAPLPQAVSGTSMYRVTVGPGTDSTPEVVWVIATLTSTTATVLRGMEGSTIKTHAIGDAFTHTVTAGVLSAAQMNLDVFSVLNYGADPSGAADSTAAINDAVTAAKVLGGIVYFPQGTYKTTSTINVDIGSTANYYPVYIQGAGRYASVIEPTSAVTGDTMWIRNSNLYGAVNGPGPYVYGGGIRGITFNGVNTTGDAVGLHIGDLYLGQVDVDVINYTGTTGTPVAGVTGAIGVHFDNYYYCTEQLHGHVFAGNNTNCVVFDNNIARPGNSNGSFDRFDLDIDIDNGTATQNGVMFTNGAYCTGGKLSITGNFGTSSSALTSYVLGFSNTHESADGAYASLTNVDILIDVEADGGLAHGPYSIYMPSGGNNYIVGCWGEMNFLNFTFQTQVWTAATNVTNFTFDGFIFGDSTLIENNGLSGTVTLNGTTAVTKSSQWVQTGSIIDFVSLKTAGGTVGVPYVSTAPSPGTGGYGSGTFSVKSTSSSDTSVWNYRIIN